jgi:hypothetical protein
MECYEHIGQWLQKRGKLRDRLNGKPHVQTDLLVTTAPARIEDISPAALLRYVQSSSALKPWPLGWASRLIDEPATQFTRIAIKQLLCLAQSTSDVMRMCVGLLPASSHGMDHLYNSLLEFALMLAS